MLFSVQFDSRDRTNPCVSLFSLDLTKAFDCVRHHTLSQKLTSLNIPDEIYNCHVTFLNGRSHVTRYAGRTSSIAYINASVVQGSVIGPSSDDVLASDLYPLSLQNIIKICGWQLPCSSFLQPPYCSF